LRAWSRTAVDLRQERNRFANRVSEQLWRYYPQALAVTDDLAADWFLESLAAAPTPAKAARVRDSSIERLLKGAPHPTDRCGGGVADLAAAAADGGGRHRRGGKRAYSRPYDAS
jgi:hypothetical protein